MVDSPFGKKMDDLVRQKYGMTCLDIIEAREQGRNQFNDEKVAESYRLRGMREKLI